MFKLRNVTIEDIEDIILINEDAIPAVNSVSYEEFLNFYEKNTYFKVAINNKQNVLNLNKNPHLSKEVKKVLYENLLVIFPEVLRKAKNCLPGM